MAFHNASKFKLERVFDGLLLLMVF